MWGPWGKEKDPGSALNPWSGTWESIFLIVPQRQTPKSGLGRLLNLSPSEKQQQWWQWWLWQWQWTDQLPGHEPPYGEAHVRTCWWWPLANIQRGHEAFGPMAHKELNPVHNYVSELGSRSVPSRAFRWDPSPAQKLDYIKWETLRQKTQLNYTWVPDPQKLWNKYFMF